MAKKGSGAKTEVEQIRAALGHLTFKAPPPAWLNIGDKRVHSVFGDDELGLPYGKVYEISGWQSGGKSGLGYFLLAMGQQDGADVSLADFENANMQDSEHPGRAHPTSWVAKRGVDVGKLTLFQPYVGHFDGPKKPPRICTAEELCQEIELFLETRFRAGIMKQILMVDSVPAMLPEHAAEAGLVGRKLPERNSLATFMSALMPRWVGIAAAYNVMMIFINQLRQKPMSFGDPSYEPGGNALPFFASSRVRVKRVAGGLILKKGKKVGLKGVIINKKNRCGGLEKTEIGYKMLFRGPIEFVNAEEVKPKKDDE
jgi:RecA/RadA recombinase